MTNKCLIVAEAGVNHNGDLGMALELVDKASELGADVIKFQTFRADLLAHRKAQKANYQQRLSIKDETQYDMLKRLELSAESHIEIINRCKSKGIQFLSAPFEMLSLDFLVSDLKQQTIKLGSGELTNAPLLLAAARSGVDIILSTGMGTLSEVEEALGVLAYGYLGRQNPNRAAFREALLEPIAWELLKSHVTLLHCTTEYPAAVEQVNLMAMKTLSAAFGLSVGYSDHTDGNAISIAAVALGARIIEKHFTLDRSLPGPDHAASLDVVGFNELVNGIREVEVAFGNGIKQPYPPEIANKAVVRRSVVASRDLRKGTVLAEQDLTVLRPGNGVSPLFFWDIIGSTLKIDLTAGDPITNSDEYLA
jgi:N-acetylneuraminate synthase